MENVFKQVVKSLQDKNLTVVAQRTKISRITLKNLRDGFNVNPTLKTLTILHKYLEL